MREHAGSREAGQLKSEKLSVEVRGQFGVQDHPYGRNELKETGAGRYQDNGNERQTEMAKMQRLYSLPPWVKKGCARGSGECDEEVSQERKERRSRDVGNWQLATGRKLAARAGQTHSRALFIPLAQRPR